MHEQRPGQGADKKKAGVRRLSHRSARMALERLRSDWIGAAGFLGGVLHLLTNLLYVLAALGVLTIVFGLFAVPRILPEGRRLYFFSGFYCGGGTGLTASVAWNIRRLRRTLRDETALRRAFTEQTDERNAMITNRAARAAGLALCVLLYVGVFFVGLFVPALFLFCLAGALAYSLLFFLFRLYYSRKF